MVLTGSSIIRKEPKMIGDTHQDAGRKDKDSKRTKKSVLECKKAEHIHKCKSVYYETRINIFTNSSLQNFGGVQKEAKELNFVGPNEL